MARVVIVGAGISGLSLAYRLTQLTPAAEVLVLEQGDRPGGTVWTEHRAGFTIELGPNAFIETKPSTLRLCNEIGLGGELLPASETSGKNRYLFLDEKLHLLPKNSLTSILRSPLLTWRGKLRLLSERFRPPRHDTTAESIDAFVRRRAGPEAARIFADAMVTGFFAGDATLLSMRAAFPRLVAFEESDGSVMKGIARLARERRAAAASRGEPHQPAGRMWSFRAGMRTLIEALAQKLPAPPILGVHVQRIARAIVDSQSAAWTVRGEGADRWHADAVVLTCPSYAQAGMVADLDAGLAAEIAGIAYNRIAVVALGYRQEDIPIKLDGFGFIAPQNTRRDILGVQWCSSIFPGRAPPGFVLLRAMCGGWNRPEIVGWDESRLLDAVRAELLTAMRIEAPPVFHHVARWDRAIPQYHLGHLERVASIEARTKAHPGLFVGGNAYHGVALNDCTEQAETLAGQVADYLTRVSG
jgi:oxygen-dependent protoporphyrinogen oxidase